jgi:hypothetical protein
VNHGQDEIHKLLIEQGKATHEHTEKHPHPPAEMDLTRPVYQDDKHGG